MRGRFAIVFLLLVSFAGVSSPELASSNLRGSSQAPAVSASRQEVVNRRGPIESKAFRPTPPPQAATVTPPLKTFQPAPARSETAPSQASGNPVIGTPACSAIGPAGKACDFEVTGARISVVGAQVDALSGDPLIIDVHLTDAGGKLGTLVGTCAGIQACVGRISTAQLPRGARLRCVVRSAGGRAAFACSPFSDDTPLDYTIRLMRKNGTEEWISAKAGAPQPIDAAGTGVPDASVVVLAGPAAVAIPPSLPGLPPSLGDSTSTTARVLVSSVSGEVIPFGLEIYYQADQLYHFGFDGRVAGAPAQFDATITASADRVDLRAVPVNASTQLTLLGGVTDGTLKTRGWPATSIDSSVEIGPVPPAIDVTIEPAGHARVGMAGAPNVRATIDQFEATSSITGVRQRTVADMPKGAPTTLDVNWSADPVDGKKASTFKLNPAPAIVELGLQYSKKQVVRANKGAETQSLNTDAVATITGIPAGETVIQMIGAGDNSKVVLRAPSAIGSIEFGFGDTTPAGFWPPPTAGADYVYMKKISETAKKLAVRISALASATVESRPAGIPGASVLAFSMTHSPAKMHLNIENGGTSFYGSLVPPAVTEAEIYTNGSKVTVKPTSSGDITNVDLHARSAGSPFFGTVREIDLALSNVGPDTKITVDSASGNLTFTFKAVVPITSLDAQLRAGSTPDALLPPDTDGILLHQDKDQPSLLPFNAHLHLSGLTSATVKKMASSAPGAKPDDFALSLDLEHSPRSFSVNVIDGAKKIWGSFGLPQKLGLTVDTGSATAAVGADSSDDIRSIDLHLRTTGAAFFGSVKQLDFAISNIPVGASFGVTSGGGELKLAYTGGNRSISSADVQLRQGDQGDTLPAGKDGVLLHDLSSFSAHFRLTDLLSMSAHQQDCGNSSTKCQRISASIKRATQQDTTVSIQTVPDDKICTKSGNPPVETCTAMTTTPDATVFTLNSAPKTLNIAMNTVSNKIDFTFLGVRSITSALLGITIAYGASDVSGAASLTQSGASSNLSLSVASLPSGPFDENNRQGNAVFFCLYKSSGCTTPPRDVGAQYTSISLQFFAAAPVTISSLFSCSSLSDCSQGKGIHGDQLTAQTLQFAYAEVPGTVYNSRFIFADTGSRSSTATGRFRLDSPNIDLKPSGMWAEGAQVELGALYAPVKSYGKINCDGLNLSVEGVGIPATALKALTGLCG